MLTSNCVDYLMSLLLIVLLSTLSQIFHHTYPDVTIYGDILGTVTPWVKLGTNMVSRRGLLELRR